MTRKQRNNLIATILMLPLFAGDVALVILGKIPVVQAALPCTHGS
jgi:hypothetical protein